MPKTKIEWTDRSWNPIVGCTNVSEGCRNCYARVMSARVANQGRKATEEGKDPTPIQAAYMDAVKKNDYGFYTDDWTGHIGAIESRLLEPLSWRKPYKVFVNSMSDLFHPNVPFDVIDKIFSVMALAKDHTFQVLTKRPERMSEYLNEYLNEDSWRGTLGYSYVEYCSLLNPNPSMNPDDVWDHLAKTDWPAPNVWLGTSVENQKAADERIPHLLRCPAAVRFLSCEPLLGPVDLMAGDCYLCDDYGRKLAIDQVIVGGESGPKARPMHPDWARSLRDQCIRTETPFFFKQWGKYRDGSEPGHETIAVLNDGNYLPYKDPFSPKISAKEWNDKDPKAMAKMGKKAAGRLLDGEEWNQYPEVEK